MRSNKQLQYPLSVINEKDLFKVTTACFHTLNRLLPIYPFTQNPIQSQQNNVANGRPLALVLLF